MFLLNSLELFLDLVEFILNPTQLEFADIQSFRLITEISNLSTFIDSFWAISVILLNWCLHSLRVCFILLASTQ